MTVYLIAIIASLVVIGLYSLFYQQQKRHQYQLEKIVDLQNQLSILTAGAVGVDERILMFERALAQLKEQQGSLNLGASPQQNYDHAIRLAKKGVAVDQLIDSCNLTDEEAHLIEQMYGTVGVNTNRQSDLH